MSLAVFALVIASVADSILWTERDKSSGEGGGGGDGALG